LTFSNNADFSSPLGTLNVSGYRQARLVDLTGFDAGDGITARYVRFQSTAFGGNGFTGLSEVAFYASAIPEPASVGLIGLATLSLLSRRRRIG